MKVFIGSSSEQKQLVEWMTAFIGREYKGRIQPIPWTAKSIWPGGEFTLESLERVVEDTDAAILFWTADDKTWYRNAERHEPRDNLVFEAGLFIGSHGRLRMQLMEPIYAVTDPRRTLSGPSDVLGMTTNRYDWVDNDLDSSGLAKTARDVCDHILKLGRRLRTSDKLEHLKRIPGIEEFKTFVGGWNSISANGFDWLVKKGAQEIDLLVAYSVKQIRDTLENNFKERSGAKLRACFANLFDRAVCDAYKRKYQNRSLKDLQTSLEQSIKFLLGGKCTLNVEYQKTDSAHDAMEGENAKDNGAVVKQVFVTGLVDGPKAEYDLRLTNQRITFSYYRVDDCAFLVPLDMSNPKPPVLVWVLDKVTSPAAYNFYLEEFNFVFEEAKANRVEMRG